MITKVRTGCLQGPVGVLGAVFDLGGGYTDVCFIILLNCPNMFYAVFYM